MRKTAKLITPTLISCKPSKQNQTLPLRFPYTHKHLLISLYIHLPTQLPLQLIKQKNQKEERKANQARTQLPLQLIKQRNSAEEKKANQARMEATLPLLNPQTIIKDSINTPIQKAISQTFRSSAQLTKLLPTGTVMAFQLLVPIFTNQGHCNETDMYLTGSLVILCAVSCFILSFTDTYRDRTGTVRHGIATLNGFWVIDGTGTVPDEIAEGYRIRFIDFIHAVVSVFVFIAVAMFDQNIVGCFYPVPTENTKHVLKSVPVGIGVVSSMLFVTFPTTRHGIGFPLTQQ
ncbi:hypothetical protein LUZ60_008116 [Juncus effusus]|nr:hypothetical protein LUZ60_008116 [Juncus effusus]